jgi:hypothetical protein
MVEVVRAVLPSDPVHKSPLRGQGGHGGQPVILCPGLGTAKADTAPSQGAIDTLSLESRNGRVLKRSVLRNPKTSGFGIADTLEKKYWQLDSRLLDTAFIHWIDCVPQKIPARRFRHINRA